MKLIMALVFALQSIVVFATGYTIHHPQLSGSQEKFVFQAQASKCATEAKVLADPVYTACVQNIRNRYGLNNPMFNNLPVGQNVGISECEPDRQKLMEDVSMACLMKEGWVFTPKP